MTTMIPGDTKLSELKWEKAGQPCRTACGFCILVRRPYQTGPVHLPHSRSHCLPHSSAYLSR